MATFTPFRPTGRDRRASTGSAALLSIVVLLLVSSCGGSDERLSIRAGSYVITDAVLAGKTTSNYGSIECEWSKETCTRLRRLFELRFFLVFLDSPPGGGPFPSGACDGAGKDRPYVVTNGKRHTCHAVEGCETLSSGGAPTRTTLLLEFRVPKTARPPFVLFLPATAPVRLAEVSEVDEGGEIPRYESTAHTVRIGDCETA